MHMRVAVAVVTYQRPQGLARTLESLRHLDRPADEVIVVDNDAMASEQPMSIRPSGVHWSVERTPGIAAARNKAILVAKNLGMDAVAFIDDDEVAQADWLGSLERNMQKYSASAVGGPVVPRYQSGAPAHVISDGFFASPQYLDGEFIRRCSTGNVLIRLSALTNAAPFDIEFGLSGGSDSELFERLHRNGHKFVWSSSACVTEFLPIARTQPAWIVERLKRFGNTDGRIALKYRPRLFVGIAGLLRVVAGLAPHLARGLHRSGGSWKHSASYLRGVGMLQAAIGEVRHGYQR